MADTRNAQVKRYISIRDEHVLVSGTTMWLTSHPARLPIPAKLFYRSGDPYAVTVEFAMPDGAGIVWRFARDLILDGFHRPAGLGDIRLFPMGQFVVLDLCSPDGTARLAVAAGELSEFVDETVKTVAIGEESRHIVLADDLGSFIAGTVGGEGDHAPAV